MARMSFSLPNTQKPVQGPVGINVDFSFTALIQQISSDLALEQMQGVIEFVQSIYIDNRLNAQPFVITFSGLQQTIQCRPGRSGIFPVIAANGSLAFTAVSPVAAPLTVRTIMMNVEQNYFVWDN